MRLIDVLKLVPIFALIAFMIGCDGLPLPEEEDEDEEAAELSDDTGTGGETDPDEAE